jgi:predicted GIY-YIG superfamily endonuclease
MSSLFTGTFVYVIRVRDLPFYVGQTNNIVQRLEQHRSGNSSCTKALYGDSCDKISLVELLACDSEQASFKLEWDKVIDLMAEHGVHRVFGASFAKVARTAELSLCIQRQVDSIKGRCFFCRECGHKAKSCPRRLAGGKRPLEETADSEEHRRTRVRSEVRREADASAPNAAIVNSVTASAPKKLTTAERHQREVEADPLLDLLRCVPHDTILKMVFNCGAYSFDIASPPPTLLKSFLDRRHTSFSKNNAHADPNTLLLVDFWVALPLGDPLLAELSVEMSEALERARSKPLASDPLHVALKAQETLRRRASNLDRNRSFQIPRTRGADGHLESWTQLLTDSDLVPLLVRWLQQRADSTPEKPLVFWGDLCGVVNAVVEMKRNDPLLQLLHEYEGGKRALDGARQNLLEDVNNSNNPSRSWVKLGRDFVDQILVK